MELRLYSFVNFYLSARQGGIQTGHASVRLLRKYAKLGEAWSYKLDMVNDWADNHETYIVLNGGPMTGVKGALDIIEKCEYPFSPFYESGEALGGILTCVAVVLPETVYNAMYNKNDVFPEWVYIDPISGSITQYSPEVLELVKLVKSSRLF